MRKLVTLRKISDISPIDGADFIVAVQVDGWQCIAKKNEFNVGDIAVFFEIDSMLPMSDSRFSFLSSKAKEYDGEERARIKTMKMKGVLSQGLVLPVEPFMNEIKNTICQNINATLEEDEIYLFIEEDIEKYMDDVDLSEALNVIKYDLPDFDSFSKNGKPAGDFPHFIAKTDQNRIQNVFNRIGKLDPETEFVPTLKMDGSSTTIAYLTNPAFNIAKLDTDEDGGQLVVCSRNLVLKPEMSCKWHYAIFKDGLDVAIKGYHLETGKNYAFQGELCGPNIQQNHENQTDYNIYLFSIYDIDTGSYLSVDEMDEVFSHELFKNVKRVIQYETVKVGDFTSYADYLLYAENIASPHSKNPEGVVFHQKTKTGKDLVTFKAISNRYLLKTGR